jgi:outer membrane protein
MTKKEKAWFFAFVLLLGNGKVGAQAPPDTLIRLEGALQLAKHNFPLLKARRLEADAARQNVEVTKYTRMPSIDATYQANLSTANKFTYALCGVFLTKLS